jgi:hypothetical protein
MNEFALAHTRAWVERAVIGLNLCPFAKAPHNKGLVRYALTTTTDPLALLATLIEELRHLANVPIEQIETTLLVHPNALLDFAEYNDFLELAEAAVNDQGLDGVLQVASFHPHYQFADTTADDITNATNRSPYPTLHLIREESINRAVAAFPEADSIYETNIETMERLGAQGWAQLQRQCREQALDEAAPGGAAEGPA